MVHTNTHIYIIYINYLDQDILTLMLMVANLTNTKCCKKSEKMAETLANGYSSESTQRELSNEKPTWQGSDGF